MGTISFTQQQQREITKSILELPITLNGQPSLGVTGLYDSLQTAIDEKAQFQVDDNNKKVFFDNAKLSIDTYVQELLAIVGKTRTAYNEADLISSAKHDLPHYPKTTWFNAVIKIIDSNNGNPRNNSAGTPETETPEALRDAIDGYTGGSSPSSPLNTVLAQPYVIGEGFVHTAGTGGSIGDLILVTELGSTMVGAITNITPPDGTCTNPAFDNDEAGCLLDDPMNVYTPLGAQKVFFDVISGEAAFTTSANITNSYAGFTNAERGRQVGLTPERTALRDALEGVIGDIIDSWEVILANVSGILDTQINSGDNTQVAANQTAKDDITAIEADIIDWDDEVVADPNGKYTDAKLIPLIRDNAVARIAAIPVRETQIDGFIGSVSQTPDGAVSGSGQYLNLTSIIKSRIDLVGGSLSSFFQADTTVNSIQQDIDQKEDDLARFKLSFAVGAIDADTELGQIEFTVDDVSEFSPGQTVEVFDDDSVFFTRNIDTINGNVIRLDSGIGGILQVAKFARITRTK